MVLLGRTTARQLCLAIGAVYPIYKSTQALRRQEPQELLQWTTFWTTSALFWALELVGDAVIGWLPFYYEAKIVFLLWLVVPSYCGARVLHHRWLAPTFEKHEEAIDDTISSIKRRASAKVVQVCKETAVLAIRRGSGVVAQSQQYVAAQLVQQALGKLGGPVQSANEVPTLLSLLSAATTAAATTTPSSTSSTELYAITAEPKRLNNSPKKRTHDDWKGRDAKEDDDQSSTEVAEKSTVVVHASEKDTEESDSSPTKFQGVAERTAQDVVERSSVAKNDLSTQPASSKPTRATSVASPQEKSKELVSHFKKLLVKGFKLRYYPSRGVVKQRILCLKDTRSRFIVFESANQGDSTSGVNKKSVKLFIHNIRRISSGQHEETDAKDTSLLQEQDGSLAFVLDNGKSRLLFEAENQKTRDLLVAGMRLLGNEHKRNDVAALSTFAHLYERQAKQYAFDKLLYATLKSRAQLR